MEEVTQLLGETEAMAKEMGLDELKHDHVQDQLNAAVQKAVAALKARKRRMEILKGVQERELKVSSRAFKKPHTLRFKGEQAFLEGDGNTHILKAKERAFKVVAHNPDGWGAQVVNFEHRDDKHEIKISILLYDEERSIEERIGGGFKILKGKGRGYNALEVMSE